MAYVRKHGLKTRYLQGEIAVSANKLRLNTTDNIPAGAALAAQVLSERDRYLRCSHPLLTGAGRFWVGVIVVAGFQYLPSLSSISTDFGDLSGTLKWRLLKRTNENVMKSLKLISALIIAGGALASQIAAAAPTSGTITFNGALVADTCVVDAGAGNSFAVTLPSVQTTAFTGVGNAQGTTPFTIALTGCSVGVPVRAFFSGANINGTTGNLTNLGVATGVEVQMLNSTNAVINLAGADATAQGDTLLTTDATGAATLGYSAQYLSTAAAPTAGSVTSNVNYEIVYQ